MSNKFVFVGDLVEKNGKTVKQNNLERQHKIPLGSLVEVGGDDSINTKGCRLFVVDCSRDCDGTPLYTLSFDKEAMREYRDAVDNCEKCDTNLEKQLSKLIEWKAMGRLDSGYPEHLLTAIKQGE